MRPRPKGHPALRIWGLSELRWQTQRYAADALRSNIGDVHATTLLRIMGETAESRNRGIAESRNCGIAKSRNPEMRNRGIAKSWNREIKEMRNREIAESRNCGIAKSRKLADSQNREIAESGIGIGNRDWKYATSALIGNLELEWEITIVSGNRELEIRTSKIHIQSCGREQTRDD